MSLSDVLLSCEGRIPRSTYWFFSLAFGGLSLLLALLDIMLGTTDPYSGYGVLRLLFVFAAAVPAWAVAVKRAHDRGHPNWWLFFGLIPFIGPLWMLVELGLLRGTRGPNKYGEDPTYVIGPPRATAR